MLMDTLQIISIRCKKLVITIVLGQKRSMIRLQSKIGKHEYNKIAAMYKTEYKG